MISLREAKQRNSVPPDNCAGVGFKAYCTRAENKS